MSDTPEILTNTAAATHLLALLHQPTQNPSGTHPAPENRDLTDAPKGGPMTTTTRDREYPATSTTPVSPASHGHQAGPR